MKYRLGKNDDGRKTMHTLRRSYGSLQYFSLAWRSKITSEIDVFLKMDFPLLFYKEIYQFFHLLAFSVDSFLH